MTGPRTGEQVAALIRGALEVTSLPRTPTGTRGLEPAPAPAPALGPAHARPGPRPARSATSSEEHPKRRVELPPPVEPVPAPEPAERAKAAFLARLRETYAGWAIVADLRGGQWAAADGYQEIWRDNGIELAKALEAATGRAVG